MSKYCELVLNCRLVKDVHPDVIEALKAMLAVNAEKQSYSGEYVEVVDESTPLEFEEMEKQDERLRELFDHPLFQIENGVIKILRCAHRVQWGKAISALYHGARDEYYYLSVRTNLKSWGLELFELFLDWLAPYVDTEGFAGYMKGEEEEEPVLIYFNEGKALVHNIVPVPIRPVDELKSHFNLKE